ncbi:MAG: hypothetical protein M1313_03025, partial [Nitrospirae bacterium]|nr:hypothetical protein [Nitrospirota bacterium]
MASPQAPCLHRPRLPAEDPPEVLKKKVFLTLPQIHRLTVDVLPRLEFSGADALEILSYYRHNNRKSRLSREKKARLQYDVPRARAG